MKLLLSILMSTSLLWTGLAFATTQETPTSPASQINSITTQTIATEKVNINTASAQDIAKQLSGVGIKKAERIVEYREKYGSFTKIEQITEVSGIGKAIFEANRDKLVL